MTRAAKIDPTKLRHLIMQGRSTADIAAHFGVQSPAVTRSCRAHGLSLPSGRVNKEPSRADDERDLDCIRRLMAGEGYRSVANRYGMGSTTMNKAVMAIEAADIAESGEPVRIVARGYAWPRRAKRAA